MTPQIVAWAALIATGQTAETTDDNTEKVHCQQDPQGYCINTIVRWPLYFSEPDPVIHVRIAPGLGTVIELPKDVKQVGDAVLSNEGYLQIVRNTANKERPATDVFVMPKKPDSAPADFSMASLMDMTAGTVRITFEVGVTLLVRFMLGKAEPGQAVERLVLSFPEAEAKKAWAVQQVESLMKPRLRKLKEREAQLDQEAQAVGYREFVLGRLRRNQCRKIDIAGEHGLAIVRVSQLCHIGNRMLADFEIFNRSKKSSFIVREIAVKSNKQVQASEYALKTGTSMPEIVFSKRATLGTVWWKATDDVSFEIVVTEHGGRGRSVQVKGVRF